MTLMGCKALLLGPIATRHSTDSVCPSHCAVDVGTAGFREHNFWLGTPSKSFIAIPVDICIQCGMEIGLPPEVVA